MNEVKIIFTNGKELTAEQNGNCYIVDEKPEFPEDLSIVTIISDNDETIFHDAIIAECASVDERYWFAFIEEDKREKEIRELREDMTDALNGLLEFVLGGE